MSDRSKSPDCRGGGAGVLGGERDPLPGLTNFTTPKSLEGS